ncbi:PrgI family protein [Butyrivibrio hungatei]|uniref:PrgI family protein n=1 Tax=Butyrivibrio hungatei TaxID=185008 RepID=A0A1D9P5Q0_9FIRM|nr:PrgI family protein [Butyrivibrio hungatei]AOZ97833.1 hypothetical protein bhn_II034 [Butyrivibrio hungatei]
MANGTYDIPRELKDEDKWFKFFTKTQLFIFGIGLLIAAFFAFIFVPMGLIPVAIVIAVITLSIAGVLAFFPMPNSKYLYGGGYPLYIIVLRLLTKFFGKKKLYLKNYDSEEND